MVPRRLNWTEHRDVAGKSNASQVVYSSDTGMTKLYDKCFVLFRIRHRTPQLANQLITGVIWLIKFKLWVTTAPGVLYIYYWNIKLQPIINVYMIAPCFTGW